jgi:hypothetical protein
MKKLLLFAVLLVCFSLINSCSKTTDQPATDTYIPDLSAAQWTNVNDAADVIFFFNTPPVGTASGTFSGNRNGTANSGGFTGSFTNSAIQLTFNSGVNNGRAFSGNINGAVSPVVFTITSPAAGANAAITLTFKK